ncbi:MAG: hypothetical protein ACOX4J_02595 [Anaerovoracaceae bacterium]|jgi:hypothetical protein
MEKIFNRAGLFFLAAAVVGMLGVSYAAYTNILTVETDIATGSMRFEFTDIEEEGAIVGVRDKNGNIRKLDANIEYDGKSLRITDMEAIPMSMLEDGDMELHILYAVKATEGQSILRAAELCEKDEARSIIGKIPFKLTTGTPQWSIEGDSKSLGSGTEGLDGIPKIVYDLLPDDLGDFRVHHTLAINESKNRMEGTIVLEQMEPCKLLADGSLSLSDFDLPEEIYEEIGAESNLRLSLQGCYGFEIPLVLDQFNAK